jgi:hypothetical protein
MSFRTATSLCLALAALPLVACNQLEPIEEETGGGGGGGIPPAVRMAFEASCGKGGCHAPGGIQPTLAGAELDGILTGMGGGLPYVTIGDTSNSYLAIVMMADETLAELGLTRTVPRMPIDRNPADEAQAANLNTILAWIAGAEYPGGGDATTGGEMTTGDATGSTGGGALEPTFTNVQTILNAKCSCHAGPAGAGNGNFSFGTAEHAKIVDVKSSTALDFVEPSSPEMSYLWLKIDGGFEGAGGAGTLMPPPMGGLSADELTLIEDWITMGALDN